MALRTELDELLAAWRALADQHCGDGWRTIPVAMGGPCQLRAGRYFPGNEEALLVGFVSAHVPAADQLPQGLGFVVSRADIGSESASCEWVALRRQSAGQLDLFAMMVVDIVATLASLASSDGGKIVQAFLSRIRAWQEFMRRGAEGVLSCEAEVGLFGELEVLRRLIATDIPTVTCIDAWDGPHDGLHDFSFGSGALEVKSSLSHQGFQAKIGSLEQLDTSLKHPLFLAGVRLVLKADGRTLPELISDIRDALSEDQPAFIGFNTRLLHAGYFDQFADRYVRRFLCMEIRTWLVDEVFPCFARGTIPIAIRTARYEIDLDLVATGKVDFMTALKRLGVA